MGGCPLYPAVPWSAVSSWACGRPVGRAAVSAEVDVADVAVVAAVDGGVAGDLGAVRHVEGSGPVEDRFEGDGAADEVVDERPALAEQLQRGWRCEDVVLDEVGAVADLDEQVATVVVEHVSRHPGALGLPVEPGAERAVVDSVVPDDDVDGGMQLDAGDLVAVELALERDVVDVVVLDGGERAAEVADDAGLSAVVDGVAADDVRADVLPVPADLAGGEHRLQLVLVSGLVPAYRRGVVAGGGFLADRDGRALGVVDSVVLDDPALRPVRADETGLVGGRRCPRAGGLSQLEPAHGDEVDVVLGRVEDGASHVDLDGVRVGVGTLEVGPDRRRVVLDFGVPDQLSTRRLRDLLGDPGPVVGHPGAKRRVGDGVT